MDEVSQPSRTFESPRARRVAQDKRALLARRKRLGNKPKKSDLDVHAKRTRFLVRSDFFFRPAVPPPKLERSFRRPPTVLLSFLEA